MRASGFQRGRARSGPISKHRNHDMNRFAELLDRLVYEPGRNNKLRLITDYFRTTPDPERGFALAALTGALSFRHAKPGVLRALIAERTDPVLFELSYDYVGDLSETIALMWPARTAPAVTTPSTRSLYALPPRSEASGGEGWGGGCCGGRRNAPHPRPLPTIRYANGRRGAHRAGCQRRTSLPDPLDRRHHALHARQVAIAGAARALARHARRDRTLGAAQARHRRACASASRRGSPRPRPPHSATRTRRRSN